MESKTKHSQVVLKEDGSNLVPSIIAVAIPTIISGFLKTSFVFVDTYFAGKISTDALAALAGASFLVWILETLSQLNSVGALSLLSRAIGEKDYKKMNFIFRKSLKVSLFSSLIVSSIFIYLLPFLVGLLALPIGVEQNAYDYLFVLFLSGPLFWVFDTLEQSFRGAGDPVTPVWITFIFVILNCILDPLFALGYGPIPAMGFMGIALATSITWLGGALTLYILAIKRGYLSVNYSEKYTLKLKELWLIGAPMALSGSFFCLIWVILTPLISKEGSGALGAVSVAHRLEALPYLISLGFYTASASLVGQAMGLKKPNLITKIAFKSALCIFALNGIFYLIFINFTSEIIGIFSKDPEVIKFGIMYFIFAAFAIPFQGLELSFQGAFAGVGKTALAMLLGIIFYTLRIPISYLYFDDYGCEAVFFSIGISATLAGISLLVLFKLKTLEPRKKEFLGF